MADLRKEELFPADAFGLFYLQITRIPGGWHRHAEYEIFYHIGGPLVFEVEGELYPLRPGDFLLLQVQKAPETYGHAINQLSMMSLFLVNLYNQDAELRKQEIENRSLTENVTEYINQHYADSLTIDQLAEQFFVSKYHLMHEFSQKTGTSVYRYLMQQRLHAVCELLEQGTVPNEAYLLCGFKDYANFYRAFRSAYGQSPREYARAHRRAAEEPASPDA